MDEGTPIGERIAHYRTQRKMSRRTLAELVDRSESWLEKIEYGERVMDSITMLQTLANVLKVTVWDLKPNLGLAPNGGAPLDPPQGIPAISRAIRVGGIPDREAPTATELRARLDYAQGLRGRGSWKALSIGLPDLLADAQAAASQDVEGAWWCRAGAYGLASSIARALGHVELAWFAAEKAVDSAQRSGDKILEAKSVRKLANAFMNENRLDQAGAVLSDAADAIAPTNSSSLAVWSVWGSLRLAEAVAAARATDWAGSRGLLRSAHAAAERVGRERNDYWESFGPANVGTIEVVMALESGDPLRALSLADRVVIEDLPTAARRARFCIYVAHAHSLRKGGGADSVLWLLEAERHSPEVIRHSVKVHELIRVRMSHDKRLRTPQLRGLVDRLKIAR